MAAVVMEDLLLLISLLAEATEGIQRQSKDQIEVQPTKGSSR